MSNAVNVVPFLKKSDSVSDVFKLSTPPGITIPGGFGPGSNVDENPLYVFREDLVKDLFIWWTGAIGKTLYLFGPTGSGKTTLIEQFGAVMGFPVYLVGMHNRLEYSDTLGNFQLVQVDQSTPDEIPSSGGMLGMLAKMVNAIKSMANSGIKTKFVSSELGLALRHSKKSKVILCLDEMDQLDPSQAMAFNKVMSGAPVILPTGETLDAKNIWFAGTGNTKSGDSRGVYKGAKQQNVAFKSRFCLHLEVDYPKIEDEKKILENVAPQMAEEMREKLIEFAVEMRKLFVSCDVDVPLATRTLIFWAKYAVLKNKSPNCSPIKEGLQKTFANQCSDEDAVKVMGAWDRFEEDATTKATP